MHSKSIWWHFHRLLKTEQAAQKGQFYITEETWSPSPGLKGWFEIRSLTDNANHNHPVIHAFKYHTKFPFWILDSFDDVWQHFEIIYGLELNWLTLETLRFSSSSTNFASFFALLDHLTHLDLAPGSHHHNHNHHKQCPGKKKAVGSCQQPKPTNRSSHCHRSVGPSIMDYLHLGFDVNWFIKCQDYVGTCGRFQLLKLTLLILSSCPSKHQPFLFAS